MKVFGYMLLLLFSASAFAGVEDSVRDRIAQFLTANVMDRTQLVKTEGTMTADGDTYKIEFAATIHWSGLKTTTEGLTFEQRREISQTNTKINAEGVAIGEPEKRDRVTVVRFAVSERETTRTLVGLTTLTESSVDDPTGIGFTTMLDLSADGKELFIYQSQAGFSEASLDGKHIYPVSTAFASTLSLNEAGKLVTDETMKFYKVDINRDFAREEFNRFDLTAVESAQ